MHIYHSRRIEPKQASPLNNQIALYSTRASPRKPQTHHGTQIMHTTAVTNRIMRCAALRHNPFQVTHWAQVLPTPHMYPQSTTHARHPLTVKRVRKSAERREQSCASLSTAFSSEASREQNCPQCEQMNCFAYITQICQSFHVHPSELWLSQL